MAKTHRVSARYQTGLSVLRASIEALTDQEVREVLLGQLDHLSGLIGMGFQPLEAVEIDEAPASIGDLVQLEWLDEARATAGINGLLDDRDPVTSADRDNRFGALA